ncbi:hypothetical protein C8R46DRAFT_1211117 [Mycena filopes]|nr:hypothetical protein C8R46DRAFT_1211117 [Mycena filopes]
MPGLPDTSLPILAAPLSPAIAAKFLLTIIGLALIAVSVRYASPARLTVILSGAMDGLEKVFGDLASTGFLRVPPQDIPTILSSMQVLRVRVGSLREQRLHNSRTWGTAMGELFRGSSITLYRCIEEVKDFETRLKIFKEKQRNSAPPPAKAGPPLIVTAAPQPPPPQQQQPAPLQNQPGPARPPPYPSPTPSPTAAHSTTTPQRGRILHAPSRPEVSLYIPAASRVPGYTMPDRAPMSVLTSLLPRHWPRYAAPPAPVTAAKVMFGAGCFVFILILGRYASPAHLTRVLSDDMASLENTYTDAASTGLFRIVPVDEVEIVISMFVGVP